MLKAIVIGKIKNLPDVKVVAIVEPGIAAQQAIEQHAPDIVIVTPEIAKQQNSSSKTARQTVAASTHQGMQSVPLDEIFFFQADQKYVIAQHQRGELLINDSLNSLEREFADDFVRIHRNTLVARKQIENLYKNSAGKYMLKLRSVKQEFVVSRRQLPKLRKSLLGKYAN